MQTLQDNYFTGEVGFGLSLEGASAADLVKSMQANSELAAQKRKPS